MTMPIIYNVQLSNQTVNTRAKVMITVLAEDIELFTKEIKYARGSYYELVAGQKIGVI